LLGLSQEETEVQLSALVCEGAIFAKMDRPAGIIRFAPKVSSHALIRVVCMCLSVVVVVVICSFSYDVVDVYVCTRLRICACFQLRFHVVSLMYIEINYLINL
jgi:hypothetical protein